MEEKQLYTTQEVADELDVTRGYIHKMIERGQAQPAQKLGHIYVFTKEEVERLRTSRRPLGRPKKQ
jgi:excisionase family DNA binding protein